MSKQDEFFVGYLDSMGSGTQKSLKRFVGFSALALVIVASIFAVFQALSSNSAFDFDTATKVSGIYHESPYPMLRVQLEEGLSKDILLLGFGKYGANKYLKSLKESEKSLLNKKLIIEGNLVYYNGKTLLQIDDSEKISLASSEVVNAIQPTSIGKFEVQGEIVDPKCYFGVMKPGYGKIHRSCAALCISGGIPPVLVNADPNAVSSYLLLTDQDGKAIHDDILPFIGQPLNITGELEKLEDWFVLKINTDHIQKLSSKSTIY